MFQYWKHFPGMFQLAYIDISNDYTRTVGQAV
jgi:hypothetical protein